MAAKLTAREKQEHIFVEKAAEIGRRCMLDTINGRHAAESVAVTQYSNEIYALCKLAREIFTQEDDKETNDE